MSLTDWLKLYREVIDAEFQAEYEREPFDDSERHAFVNQNDYLLGKARDYGVSWEELGLP